MPSFGFGTILLALSVIPLAAALVIAGVKRTFAHTWYGLFAWGAGILATLATNSTELYFGAMVAGTLMILFGSYRAIRGG